MTFEEYDKLEGEARSRANASLTQRERDEISSRYLKQAQGYADESDKYSSWSHYLRGAIGNTISDVATATTKGAIGTVKGLWDITKFTSKYANPVGLVAMGLWGDKINEASDPIGKALDTAYNYYKYSGALGQSKYRGIADTAELVLPTLVTMGAGAALKGAGAAGTAASGMTAARTSGAVATASTKTAEAAPKAVNGIRKLLSKGKGAYNEVSSKVASSDFTASVARGLNSGNMTESAVSGLLRANRGVTSFAVPESVYDPMARWAGNGVKWFNTARAASPTLDAAATTAKYMVPYVVRAEGITSAREEYKPPETLPDQARIAYDTAINTLRGQLAVGKDVQSKDLRTLYLRGMDALKEFGDRKSTRPFETYGTDAETLRNNFRRDFVSHGGFAQAYTNQIDSVVLPRLLGFSAGSVYKPGMSIPGFSKKKTAELEAMRSKLLESRVPSDIDKVFREAR